MEDKARIVWFVITVAIICTIGALAMYYFVSGEYAKATFDLVMFYGLLMTTYMRLNNEINRDIGDMIDDIDDMIQRIEKEKEDLSEEIAHEEED